LKENCTVSVAISTSFSAFDRFISYDQHFHTADAKICCFHIGSPTDLPQQSSHLTCILPINIDGYVIFLLSHYVLSSDYLEILGLPIFIFLNPLVRWGLVIWLLFELPQD